MRQVQDILNQHPLHSDKQIITTTQINDGCQTDLTEILPLQKLVEQFNLLKQDISRTKDTYTAFYHQTLKERVMEVEKEIIVKFNWMEEKQQQDLERIRQANQVELQNQISKLKGVFEKKLQEKIVLKDSEYRDQINQLQNQVQEKSLENKTLTDLLKRTQNLNTQLKKMLEKKSSEYDLFQQEMEKEDDLISDLQMQVRQKEELYNQALKEKSQLQNQLENEKSQRSQLEIHNKGLRQDFSHYKDLYDAIRKKENDFKNSNNEKEESAVVQKAISKQLEALTVKHETEKQDLIKEYEQKLENEHLKSENEMKQLKSQIENLKDTHAKHLSMATDSIRLFTSSDGIKTILDRQETVLKIYQSIQDRKFPKSSQVKPASAGTNFLGRATTPVRRATLASNAQRPVLN